MKFIDNKGHRRWAFRPPAGIRGAPQARASALFVGALAAAFGSAIALAQPTKLEIEMSEMLKGTLHVIPHRESADGVQQACGLEFSALTRDFSTKQGAPLKIVGSYYLRKANTGEIFQALKLGLYDGLAWDSPSAPNNAFVRAPGGLQPPRWIRSESETPGYALFLGRMDDAFMQTFASIADKETIEVGFNRVPGQQDVIVPLDLTVSETTVIDDKAVRKRDKAMVASFMKCSAELAGSTKRQ